MKFIKKLLVVGSRTFCTFCSFIQFFKFKKIENFYINDLKIAKLPLEKELFCKILE